MTFHFLLSDLVGISAGFALFSLLALVPGYSIGWLTNALGFRDRSLPFRLAASVPISLSTTPIIGYTIGRWFGFDATWLVYILLCASAATAGACRRATFFAPGFRRLWPFFALIAAWLAIASLSLADLPVGHRLYYSIIDFDYSVRIAFTHSIAAFGLPARNPFFFPGHAVDLRYHYLWLIVCAEICRLGAPFVDARTAFIAGTLWVGIGLIALIPLYLRLFTATGSDLLRRSRTGIALLAVTGLDIVPALLLVWANRAGIFSEMSPSVEWWNEQVDGWLYTMLWEPHYICALVACLTGFLILWKLPSQATWRELIVSGALAGIAFATAAGSGIYVAAVFGVFLAMWFLVLLARKLWRGAEAMGVAAIVAAALFYPFFSSLRGALAGAGPGIGTGPAPHLFQFTVRAFAPVAMVFGSEWPWQRYVANLFMLPLNYFIELGIFFVAGHMFWRRFRARKRPATLAELAALLMLATSVLICTFVKSAAILNNDLGWRGFLPAQFVLLLWASSLLSGRASRTKLATLLIVLGIAGVAYDLTILRFYPVLADFAVVPKISWLGSDRQVGLRTLANREAYAWIRARTPETAVIQQNPEPVYQDTFFGAYGDRQTIAVGYLCGSSFGGGAQECQSTIAVLNPLFEGGGTQTLAGACRKLPMDYVIAKDTDKAWHETSSWVWTGAPAYSNSFTRVFACPTSRRG